VQFRGIQSIAIRTESRHDQADLDHCKIIMPIGRNLIAKYESLAKRIAKPVPSAILRCIYFQFGMGVTGARELPK
jgi:hypothetical protein